MGFINMTPEYERAAARSFFASMGDQYMNDKYWDENGMLKSYPKVDVDLNKGTGLSAESLERDRMVMENQDKPIGSVFNFGGR